MCKALAFISSSVQEKGVWGGEVKADTILEYSHSSGSGLGVKALPSPAPPFHLQLLACECPGFFRIFCLCDRLDFMLIFFF